MANWRFLGWIVLAGTGLVAACGGGGADSSGGGFGGSTGSHDSGAGGAGAHGSGNGAGHASGTNSGSNGSFVTSTGNSTGTSGQTFDVKPSTLQTITVQAGQPIPTQGYTATLNGNPASAGWSVDRGEIGTVPGAPASSVTFTPSGNVAGLVNLTATLVAGGQTLVQQRQIMVKMVSSQNGPNGSAAEASQIATDPTTLTQGGGIGGVGGEGLGPATDPATQAALDSPADDGSSLGLTMIYPYDKTVWPRGMLAPLLMWNWSTGDADAVRIHLFTKSGSYDYSGSFGRPAVLGASPFVRHPVPQDAWDQATNSAGLLADGSADTLSLEVTIAKGGVAHGPLKQTWTVAPARLSGIIYYLSYGTKLAENLGGAKGGNGNFGGAVLSIHVGDTGPQLTAGSNGGSAECRVCHSVAANGSRLIAQAGNAGDTPTWASDLSPTGTTETLLTHNATYGGMYPDGSMVLTEGGLLLPLDVDTTPIATTGLTTYSTDVGIPAFSPDGTKVAFNPMAGPGLTAPNYKLVVMDFDAASSTFGNPTVVADDSATMGTAPEKRPGWPIFFPDGKSIVYHEQSAAGVDGNGRADLRTRKGAKAQIMWTSATDASKATVLNQLNGLDATGTSYLPKLAAATTLKTNVGGTCNPGGSCCTGDGAVVDNINPLHDDDVDLNYEPTVNPVASGGYAWVVFTSRRLYGNEATIPPFCSDPRGVDLVQNITPKKLWVAAIDLNGTSGTDASHPAFYLPGQELVAGNARGFWVLDPCKADGGSCQTGDQCCNGFCEPNGTGGALVCSSTNNTGGCSNTQEKCTTTADCCNQIKDACVNGFCTQSGPK